ncbi:uncharacterized protein LOC132041793 [Lycium ferocissimum]|uniref:uncharacterized protein LOC132041793 n=1 Tax=Lycium ferocissimum TaxID=112874 RepID=UPI0028167E02|nr:uncharacterized protein LOC132041793 [Lycium ferocissimum]
MDISRIQARAQKLEERQQQRGNEREHDRGYSQFDRSLHFGPGQFFRVSDSKYRGDLGQMRPPLPRYIQCGKSHWGHCRLGLDVCYAYGQQGQIMRDCPSRGGRGMIQPTGSAGGSSSSVRPLGQSSQTPVGHGRGIGGAPCSSGPQYCIYALAG